MARFRINDFITLGCKGDPTAASWEVSLDSGFTKIIDRSLNDTKNIYEWNSPLPKIDGKGVYKNLDKVYARVKHHSDHNSSEWYYLPPKNQNDQNINITEDETVIETVNSLEVGMDMR